jgi:nicotinate-nucleotide adenylyltransferase
VAAARAVTEALGLDRLLLVVANDPWQKSGRRQVTPAADRFALAQALAEEIPGAEASRMEIDRGGPSYSVETAEQIVAGCTGRAGRRGSGTAAPAPELFLVVGADLAGELDTWHRHDDLRRLVTVAVVSRPGRPVPGVVPGWRVVRIEGPQVDVSSSEVRERLATGRSVDGLVPERVIHCILRRDLYAVP